MSRIWQIREQVIEDPSTKLRLDFSSVYTDEVNAGNEPPTHDGLVVLRLWTSDRTRIASFLFERNGRFIKCEVEPGVRQPLPPDVQFDPKGPPAGGDPRYNAGNAGIGKPAVSGL